MTQTLLLSVPMALLWMIFARQFTIEGAAIGYIFGFVILMLIRINTTFDEEAPPVRLSRIPGQILALIIYILRLALDVFLSGIDVGSRVLHPALPINPGVQRIDTQDADNHSLVSALSAHSITITPGELVIDFEVGEDGQTVMLVHTLDQDASDREKLVRDQHNRLRLIRQILGIDSPENKES